MRNSTKAKCLGERIAALPLSPSLPLLPHLSL